MDSTLILGKEDLKKWDWAVSHACVPTSLEFGDFYRIYFSPRNYKGQSIPVYIDVDKKSLSIIRYGDPIISLGEIGTFDDGGIMPCSVVKYDNKIYLYYVGWNPSFSVPYRNSIGLMISEDGGKTFKRPFKGPIVDRNLTEPYFTASPCVILDGGRFRMWYASSTGFIETEKGPSPLYHIKYAESNDGIIWERNNVSCIIPTYYGECTARPSVLYKDGLYKMWYCYRGSSDYRDGFDSYQIGYAESNDGVAWMRMDDVIDIPVNEFNDKMKCYPNVIQSQSRLLLLYNGNSFGKDGILANMI